MFRLSRLRKHFPKAALPALLMLLQGAMQADPVAITSKISPDGANYFYDFSVTNLSSSDPNSILINLSFTLPVGSISGDPTAPFGYGAFADPGSGYLQFSAADLSGFPLGQTVDGFEFLSSMQFNTLSFDATYLNSTQTKATLFTGITSPVPSAPVPEPQTWGLLVFATVLFACRLAVPSRRETS